MAHKALPEASHSTNIHTKVFMIDSPPTIHSHPYILCCFFPSYTQPSALINTSQTEHRYILPIISRQHHNSNHSNKQTNIHNTPQFSAGTLCQSASDRWLRRRDGFISHADSHVVRSAITLCAVPIKIRITDTDSVRNVACRTAHTAASDFR